MVIAERLSEKEIGGLKVCYSTNWLEIPCMCGGLQIDSEHSWADVVKWSDELGCRQLTSEMHLRVDDYFPLKWLDIKIFERVEGNSNWKINSCDTLAGYNDKHALIHTYAFVESIILSGFASSWITLYVNAFMVEKLKEHDRVIMRNRSRKME
ncbi:unnamed protein product [Vicia faba]|uniref:Uncharacterized protein n=1 Tax=Vicia faba TaxID=3906 RepID=A0AAV1AZ02_VICFA|nr:unnamed protein product [Vicia faba]